VQPTANINHAAEVADCSRFTMTESTTEAHRSTPATTDGIKINLEVSSNLPLPMPATLSSWLDGTWLASYIEFGANPVDFARFSNYHHDTSESALQWSCAE
jgi:hypothetical protein